MKNFSADGLTKYADSVVKWFVAFLSKIKRVVKMQAATSTSVDTLTSTNNDLQASTVSEGSRNALYEDLLLGSSIILDVIYSTRENVHIVHEVFRQVI